MVRWRGLIRAVLPAMIIFVIAPSIVVTVASGQNINTILALILLLQLYVIIIQAEITLRQNALATVQYEPTLVGVVERPSHGERITKVRNAGKQPALNLYVSSVDGKTEERIESGIHAEQFRNLEPNETIPVLSLSTQEYTRRQIQLRVSYWNILGEWKETTLWKEVGDGQFLGGLGGLQPGSGFFLRSLENLSLMYTLAKLERRIPKTKPKETSHE